MRTIFAIGGILTMHGNKKFILFIGVVWLILGIAILLGSLLIKYPNLLSNISFTPPKLFVISSGSMEPAIKTGSLVVALPSKEYVQGDVITFSPTGSSKDMVTHRIGAVQYLDGINASPTYLTAGDANEDFDNWEINNSQIVGKTVFTLPYAGYGVDFAKKPFGFIFLVIVPATIVIYEEAKSLWREILKFFSKIPFPKSIKPFPKTAAIIPIFGAFFVIVAFSAAYFTDIEKSLANVLGAAASYGEKTAPLFNANAGFTCAAGATDLSSPQAKVAILKIEGGNVKATVVLKGATPNSSYDIWLNQDPGGCPLGSPTEAGAITTNGSGDGTGDAVAPLVSGATNFWISAVGGGQVLRSTAVTLP